MGESESEILMYWYDDTNRTHRAKQQKVTCKVNITHIIVLRWISLKMCKTLHNSEFENEIINLA